MAWPARATFYRDDECRRTTQTQSWQDNDDQERRQRDG